MGHGDSASIQGGGRAPTLFSIPHHQPFAPALAAGILARHPDPLARARLLILLPSARAQRALTDAFLQASNGQAALLPRMAAIGNVDEDEALGRFAVAEAGSAPILSPAMSALERTLALARLLAPQAPSPVSAVALAQLLGQVMDQLAIHGVGLAALSDVQVTDMAGHWQRNQAMLATIIDHWPGILAARGLVSGVDRREQLLAALADRWAAAPPPMPVYAAGFASAPPAVARLIGVIARLPHGALILPGLDPAMDDALISAVRAPDGATHPHHGMLALLDAIGVAPAEVAGWPHFQPAGSATPAIAARERAMASALLPASLAARWQQPAEHPAALAGMALCEARGPESEALAIALAMRRQLETPGATAALVTPSRALARRVSAALARFDLTVDDSAGEPLRLRPHGVVMAAMAAAAAARLAPVPLLALLKHPLAMPADRASWLAMVRGLDLALRGLAPRPGLAGLAAHLERRVAERPDRWSALAQWWADIASPLLAPLDALFAGDLPPTLATLIARLREAGEALAGDALWQGQDGRALSALLAELEAAPDAAHMPVPAEAAAPLVGALLDQATVRPPWRQHPRLAIWGPLEARLQSADLMILGGMNEGVWPAEPAIDPWLAPAIRTALGLPAAQARIGLMAHDLMGALSAPSLLFTRSARDDGGATTVPSRFLLRIAAAIGPIPKDATLEAAMALDGGDCPARAARPAPAPPAAARPRRLSVTDADMLAADPFSFYAKRILGLGELDPLEQEPDAAIRGSAVHRIAEQFAENPAQDPLPLIDAELRALGAGPALQLLWRPRLVGMLTWLADQLQADADAGWSVAAVEADARLERQGIELVGKADRIDRHADGQLRILDYKTGSPPSRAAFVEGHARQLPLLRLLLESGGVASVPPAHVAHLLYVKLSGGRTPGETRGANWTLDFDRFVADLDAMLAHYLTGKAPFPAKLNPVFATQYRSYDHLARLEEWIGRG